MKKVIYILIISLISFNLTTAQQKEINTDSEVGTLPGRLGVSPTGGATYTIPIDLPEGRAGMTPTLSFNYNSQAGNGLLGFGWSIGGLSAISRTGTTLYHDEVVSGVDFTNEDKLMLDGQRLIVINTSSSETEYRTEIESFSKIIGYETAGSGHKYFKVWTKSGQIIEYGNTEDSRIQALDNNNNQRLDILVWHINSIEDRFGNNIEFSYTEDPETGIGRIKKIKYGGNEITQNIYKYIIEFNTDHLQPLREDIIENYIGGSRIFESNLLDNIEIKSVSDQVIKTYKLNYSYLFYSHLESIRVFGGDENAPFYNETLFEWGNDDHQKATEEYEYNNNFVDNYFIDFTGDGKTDMIELHYSEHIHSGGVTKLYDDWHYIKREDNGFANGVQFNYAISPYFGYFLQGDFDGDGKKDMLRASYTHELHDILKVDMILFSNGTGFDQYPIELDGVSNNEIPSALKPELRVGDFDGDGIDELILSYKDKDITQNNTYIWQFNKNAPYNYLAFEDKMYYGTTEKEKATLTTGDFNGDGRTDLLRTAKYNSGGIDFYDCRLYEVDMTVEDILLISILDYPTVNHRVFTADFNGDGITDILTYEYENDEDWDFYCFNGKDSWVSFGSLALTNFDPYDPIEQYYHGISLADYNGDGKTDIAEFEVETFGQNYADYNISYSNGFDFYDYTSGQIYNHPAHGLCFMGGAWAVKDYAHHFNVDFNGNGKTDMYQNNSLYNDRIYLFDINYNYNSLLSVTNGFGSKTSISYKPLTDNEVYTKGSSQQYPIIDIQAPLYVVDNIIYDEDYGTELKTTYQYAGAKVHKCGKGFLGFTQTTVKNYQNNTQTTTNFAIFDADGNDKYYYPYPKTTEQTVLGTTDILLTTENVISVKNTISSNDFIYMPVVEVNFTHSWDMDGSFIKTVKTKTANTDANIDDYGNVKETITLVSPEELEINENDDIYLYKNTVETSYYPPDLEHWILSLPNVNKLTKEYKEDVNNNDLELKIFGYYQFGSVGWPKVEWVESLPNYSMMLGTRLNFVYDDYGNVTNETISAIHPDQQLEDRVTSYTYGEEYNGRFLTKETQSLDGVDYVTEYDYYEDQGLLKSKTFNPGDEAKSLTIEYEYDAFGKTEKVTGPDGTYTKTDFIWIPNYTGKDQIPTNALFVQSTYNNKDGKRNMYNFVFKYFDKFERELSTQSYDRNDRLITVDKYYYAEDGRLEKVSEPHFSIYQCDNYTTYKYDDLGRIELVTTPIGSVKTEYNGQSKTVTNVNTSVWKTKTINAIGLTESITDPSGTISYQYYSSGNIKTINALGATTSMYFDDAGNQTTLIDPNAGTITYLYNAYGELKEQTDAKANFTEMGYDGLGRLVNKTITNGVTGIVDETTYQFQDDQNIGGFGKLKSVIGTSGIITYNYTYDELSRVITETETHGATEYTHNYTYHPYYDKIMTLEYPSGFQVKYDYLFNGYLDKISNFSTDDMLWQPTDNNGRGQLTDYNLGNGLTTHKQFDNYGYPEAIRTSKIPSQLVQNLEFDFERVTGNLLWRKDVRPGNDMNEFFGYDTEMLNSRLTSWQARFQQEYTIAYEPNGNIFTKDDVHDSRGSYVYGNGAGPHAVTSIDLPRADYLGQPTDQSIEYTSFNKISSISQTNIEGDEEHSYELSFLYGPENERKATILTKDNSLSRIKFYIGSDYEIEKEADGSTRKLHYLYGGDGLFAIYALTTGEEAEAERNEMYYIHKDYLGSYETITNSVGEIVEKLSFDPWGRKRNPTDWTYTISPIKGIFDRGYTGHEYMDEFGLINMNGRLYDPWLGRMLSPDPFVQAPTYSQNFNRYTYAFNNPLKYTDPSGEYIFFVLPNVSWSAQGGLSIGVMAGVGIPGGLSAQVGIGYNVNSGDPYAFVGGSYAFNTVYTSWAGSSGFSVGYTAGLTMFSGFPISSNALTVGVNYNITHNSWSGNVSSWTVDQQGWTFNPSVSAMVLPEETNNLVRGQGFRNNDKVLGRFVGNGDYQGALDHFGFDGDYDPKLNEYPGVTDKESGMIRYNSIAFTNGFDYLNYIASEEMFHSRDVLKGNYKDVNWNDGYQAQMARSEGEYKANKFIYKNQGLFGKEVAQDNLVGNINAHGMMLDKSIFQPKVYHNIYKIKRLW